MKFLSDKLRLPVLSGMTALLLLAGAGCQGSELETVAPPVPEPTPTVASSIPVPTPTIARTPTPANGPTPTSGTAGAPGPSRPEATATSTPPVPTNTEIPAPAATVAPTQESVADFAALYELLDNLGGDKRVGDILNALAVCELNCLRSEVDESIYDDMAQQPALAFATIPFFLTASCIETAREADIAVALIAGAVGGLSAETERCIRDEITESYGDEPFKSLSVQPLF